MTRLLSALLLALLPTVGWIPHARVGRGASGIVRSPLPAQAVRSPGELSAELCARIVAGDASAREAPFAWHEALVPAFHSPLEPGRDAAGFTSGALPESAFDAAAAAGGGLVAASPLGGGTPDATAGDIAGEGSAGPGLDTAAGARRLPTGAAFPAEAAPGGPAGSGEGVTREQARALLLAGRARQAWRALEPLDASLSDPDAFMRAWAAWESGAPEAARLLLPFTDAAHPLACRAPAMRSAALALAEAGDAAGARRLLQSLEAELPGIRDHVLLWRVQALAGSSSPEELELLRDELAALGPSAALLREADRALARAHERTGSPARARALLERLLAGIPRGERPALLLELARLEARAGEPAAAEWRLRELVDGHPGSAEAEALVETKPPAGLPRVLMTASQRAAVLSAHGRMREAIAALTPASGPEALAARAEIRLRHGEYAAAAADYREAIDQGGDPVALGMELGKAYGRGGEPERARRLYQSLFEASPSGPRAATLAYLIADAFQDESAGAPARADSAGAPALGDSAGAWFRLLADRFPRSELAPRGLARLAHLRFATTGAGVAAELFREYLARYPRGEDARAASYWLARCAEADGRGDEARERYAELLRPDAPDYYDRLARRRMGGSGEEAVAALFAAGSAPHREALRVEAADTVIPAGSPAGPALSRARSLLLFGLTTAAQREIDEAVRLAGKSRETLRQVARWSLARGIPESAFRLGWALEASSPDPGTARLAYPPAFADYVLLESLETGVPVSLLWAIMRQESSFDPLARSPAGAVGLLQLMPATARAEVGRMGLDAYDAADLTRPESNLHLGAAHLRELIDGMDGERVAAIAAYNAGHAVAERWRDFPEADDPEGYVERIPFRETRNYVKVVIANAARYEELYGGR